MRALNEFDGVGAVTPVYIAFTATSDRFAISGIVDPVPVTAVVFSFNEARVGNISHERDSLQIIRF